VEDAEQRIPNVPVRERLVRQRARAGDFHHDIGIRRQGQQFRQIPPGVWWSGWRERLVKSEMIDHQPRARVPLRQSVALLKPSRAREVDWYGMLRGGGQNSVETGISRV